MNISSFDLEQTAVFKQKGCNVFIIIASLFFILHTALLPVPFHNESATIIYTIPNYQVQLEHHWFSPGVQRKSGEICRHRQWYNNACFLIAETYLAWGAFERLSIRSSRATCRAILLWSLVITDPERASYETECRDSRQASSNTTIHWPIYHHCQLPTSCFSPISTSWTLRKWRNAHSIFEQHS